MLSGKSAYGSQKMELLIAAQDIRESRMCLQIINYATKGEITGMIAHVLVILSIQVAPCSL